MTEPTKSGISRRTLAKGAAWSVPAAAVVAAAPAYAKSGQIITFTNRNCKMPGNSGAPYTDGGVYVLQVTNPTASPIDIVITAVGRGSASQPGSNTTVVKLSGNAPGCCTALGNAFQVPENTTATYALVTRNWGSSGTSTLTATYTVDGVLQPPATGTEQSSLNPIPGGNCGTGGSCTLLTLAERACVASATMAGCC